MSLKNSKINTLLFDLGNVIFNLDIPLAFANIQTLLKPGIEEDQVLEVINKFEVGKISSSLFINALLRLCPYTVQARDIILAWNSMLLELPKENINALISLKDKYQVYLLSNNNEMHFQYIEEYLLQNYSIDNFNQFCFHNTFYSHLIGLRKPSLQAFEYVINQTLMDPAMTLYVDDMPDNIVVGKQLGFQTILFHPGSNFVDLSNELLD